MGEGGARIAFTPPLLLRIPSLSLVPRVRLGTFPTPVERVASPPAGISPELWIKRDDLSGAPLGGNKVRALEFLLAGVRRGDDVVTVGGRGSTHALATAIYGRTLGARVHVVRWRQEMNGDARLVSARLATTGAILHDARTAPGALVTATWLRLARRARWVPPGGTNALGTLGHVNAALELAEQLAARRMPPPARIVVPLGSGGTAAGLALGLAIAGLRCTLVCVSVVPRLVASRRRVLRLAAATARFMERSTGMRFPRPDPASVEIDREQYGGAYGRETRAGREAKEWLQRTHGVAADATYSAKALAAALARRDSAAQGPTLFWLTYDARGVQQ